MAFPNNQLPLRGPPPQARQDSSAQLRGPPENSNEYSTTVRGLTVQYLRSHIWYRDDEGPMLERVRADFMGDYRLLYEGHNEPLPPKQNFDFRDPEDPLLVEADVYYNKALPPVVADNVEAEYNESLCFSKFTSQPPEVWHEENSVKTSKMVRILWNQLEKDHVQGTFGDDEDTAQIFYRLLDAEEQLEHLKMLCRFADIRQTPLDHVPLPDGTNIPSLSLRAQWLARRRWIRFLHQSSLIKGTEHTAKIEIAGILRDSHGFLEEEIQRAAGYPRNHSGANPYRPQPTMGDYQLAQKFEWLQEVGSDLHSIIEGLAKSLSEYAKTYLWKSPTAIQELFKNKQAWKLTVTKLYEELLRKQKPITYVVYHLLETERDFERRLKFDHIEDYLIEKRIVELDDENWYQNQGRFPTIQEITQEQEIFQSFMDMIASRNDQRRDHHILRDWIRARPWTQLYRVFDSSYNVSIRQGIADLRSRGVARRQANRDQINPSSTENVLSQILLVHPLDIREIGTEHWPTIDKICSICQQGYVANETLITAACEAEHLFHARCLFGWYDRFGVVQYSCPLDRQHFSLQSATVGIAALRESSYGHHHWVNGQPYTGRDPKFKYWHVNLEDPPEQGTDPMYVAHPFWQKQASEDYQSLNWELEFGYLPVEQKPEKPDNLVLSDRRAWRRKMNEKNKQIMQTDPDSIYNML